MHDLPLCRKRLRRGRRRSHVPLIVRRVLDLRLLDSDGGRRRVGRLLLHLLLFLARL